MQLISVYIHIYIAYGGVHDPTCNVASSVVPDPRVVSQILAPDLLSGIWLDHEYPTPVYVGVTSTQ